MAIALDGGYPQDRKPGTPAGQRRLTRFGRRCEQLFHLTDPHADIPAAIARDEAVDKLTASENPALAVGQTPACAEDDGGFDPRLVKESFAYVAENSEAAMEYFFARLFVHYPEMRSMFPHAMRDHMERVFAALTRIVWASDSPDSFTAYLAQLGRGHRKFGVKAKHYEPFLAVLVDTMRHFSRPYWADETQAAWATAL